MLGGSFSPCSRRRSPLQDLALESGIPLIGLNDSGGARIQEGVRSLAAYGEVFTRNVMSSGVIPQISVVLGPCAGGAAYSPALTDFVIMTRPTSSMFITGPDVIKAVTGEDVTARDLGGSLVHNSRSGVAQLLAESEGQALELVKLLLSYLPQNNTEDPPRCGPRPARPDERLAEHGRFPPTSRSLTTCTRCSTPCSTATASWRSTPTTPATASWVSPGSTAGASGSWPTSRALAAALDIDSSDKIARHVRICDAFNIPVVTFVDTPGYLPGVGQEHYGVIRHGAKVIYAYCEATVPKIQMVTRKAMGGAYLAP